MEDAFGVIFFLALVWFFGSVVVAGKAKRKGRSQGAFVLLSLLTSPIVGFIVVSLVSPAKEKVEKQALRAGNAKKCPDCAEVIRAEARVCRFCGYRFQQREAAAQQTESAEQAP